MTGEDDLARARKRVGSVVGGRWHLDKLIGLGGMAAVYAATHTRGNRRAAVKLLLPEYSADAELRARFLREGYAANIIKHPGVVTVLDDEIGADGIAFLVMELLEGDPLDVYWEKKGRNLELAHLLGLMEQTLDVLSAAHAQGIVHRDIKPDNLFVTRDGSLKVLDFGIARVAEAARSKPPGSQTRAGEVMGTPAFMAPEQARARWDMVDGRTDLWAVGATMFFLLSGGKFVHDAETGNELLILSATKPARSIASVTSGLPKPVVTIVNRALSFPRETRWADARAMQGAIRAVRAALGAKPLESFVGRQAAPLADLGDLEFGPDPAARQAEIDACKDEIARAQPLVAAAKQELAVAKQRVAELENKVAATKRVRGEHEQRFAGETGNKNAAVEALRLRLREAMMDLGRRAAEDTTVFGEEFGGMREEVTRLSSNAEAQMHSAAIHDAAVHAHDAKAFKTGIVVAAAAASFAGLSFLLLVVRLLF